jgi:hypothetical protein
MVTCIFTQRDPFAADSCYSHQNRFPGRNLYCNYNIVFVPPVAAVSPAVVIAVTVAVAAGIVVIAIAVIAVAADHSSTS